MDFISHLTAVAKMGVTELQEMPAWLQYKADIILVINGGMQEDGAEVTQNHLINRTHMDQGNILIPPSLFIFLKLILIVLSRQLYLKMENQLRLLTGNNNSTYKNSNLSFKMVWL